MGCASSRKEEPLVEDNINKQLKESFKQACLTIYGPRSLIQHTPITKSQIRRIPSLSCPWRGLSEQPQPLEADKIQNPKQIRLYLKMENFQQTGSFKLRGAFYKISKIYKYHIEEMLKNRIKVVIASTGNHAMACAHVANFYNGKITQSDISLTQEERAAEELKRQEEQKVELTVFASVHAKQEKLKALEGFRVEIEGEDCVQAEAKARQFANDNLSFYISPYNDLDIVAATATIGLEIEEFFSTKNGIDYVFVSVGGGGLISGIAYYLKQLKRSNCKVVGVQPEGNACMMNSCKIKKIDDQTPLVPTLSDGTDGGLEPGSVTFELCSRLIDEWVLVTEGELIEGLRELAKTEKVIVEGSAALVYAGALKYLSLNPVDSPNLEVNAVVVICGQNIGLEAHQQILTSQESK